MLHYRHLYIYIFIQRIVCAWEHNIYNDTLNHLNRSIETISLRNEDLMTITAKENYTDEKVSIQFYYECLCPYCIQFDTVKFTPVVQILAPYLKIQTYPYGNAKTFLRKGQYKFKCQHGPEECYGNKLHACALNLLQNITQAIQYNSCMMKTRNNGPGSDDAAADECGIERNVDAASIKECAKGNSGNQLLKYYGDESKKAHFHYVPYVLINGKVNSGSKFLKNVCAAFSNPPPPCREVLKQ